MCLAEFYKDPLCGHRWMHIATPCGPGMGFNNCPSFFENDLDYLPPDIYAPSAALTQYSNNHTTATTTLANTLYCYYDAATNCYYQIITPPPPLPVASNPQHRRRRRGARTRRHARPAPPAYWARSGEPCPECDLEGEYDRNEIRQVVRVRNGFRLGLGPGTADPGVDLRCCVVM